MITPKIHLEISNKGKIAFVKADKNYSVFYLENGRQLVSGYNLKFHESYLDLDNYMRPNRSFLIHKNYVKRLIHKNNASYIKLLNGEDVLISRRRLIIIKEKLKA